MIYSFHVTFLLRWIHSSSTFSTLWFVKFPAALSQIYIHMKIFLLLKVQGFSLCSRKWLYLMNKNLLGHCKRIVFHIYGDWQFTDPAWCHTHCFHLVSLDHISLLQWKKIAATITFHCRLPWTHIKKQQKAGKHKKFNVII